MYVCIYKRVQLSPAIHLMHENNSHAWILKFFDVGLFLLEIFTLPRKLWETHVFCFNPKTVLESLMFMFTEVWAVSFSPWVQYIPLQFRSLDSRWRQAGSRFFMGIFRLPFWAEAFSHWFQLSDFSPSVFHKFWVLPLACRDFVCFGANVRRASLGTNHLHQLHHLCFAVIPNGAWFVLSEGGWFVVVVAFYVLSSKVACLRISS